MCVSKDFTQLPQVSVLHAPQPVPHVQAVPLVSVAWQEPQEQVRSAHALRTHSSPRTPSAIAKAVKKTASRVHPQGHAHNAFLRSP